MNRTERQKLGIRRWIDNGGHGTLCWCTGVGSVKTSIIFWNSLDLLYICK